MTCISDALCDCHKLMSFTHTQFLNPPWNDIIQVQWILIKLINNRSVDAIQVPPVTHKLAATIIVFFIDDYSIISCKYSVKCS